MTDGRPLFSVVMATYGRGRHILPSVRAVLAQTLGDFELLVVGDGCTDETADIITPFLSERVRWYNRPANGGSQSFANNAGIDRARGRYIAYCGHDDIWAPDHLQAMADVFAADPAADFAVSGVLFHMPPGVPGVQVTGIFDESSAALEHFFPPSGLAHRRDVTGRIGPWGDPQATRAPVDADFQLRAARAGLRFASTGRPTVHKFAAGNRYLSYLEQSSAEQEAMLARLGEPGYAAWVDGLVAEAKAAGTFMNTRHGNYGRRKPGRVARDNARRKGNRLPPLRTLEAPRRIVQRRGHYAHDWRRNRPAAGVLWAGPNPAPKLLVPFCSAERAIMFLTVYSREPLTGFSVAGPRVGPVELSEPFRRQSSFAAIARFEFDLAPAGYTVLTLGAEPLAPDGAPLFGIGDWIIAPKSAEDPALARELARDDLAAVARRRLTAAANALVDALRPPD